MNLSRLFNILELYKAIMPEAFIPLISVIDSSLGSKLGVEMSNLASSNSRSLNFKLQVLIKFTQFV